MLIRRDRAERSGPYETIATLDPVVLEALARLGIELEPDTEYDAPGPTAFACVISDGDEFALVHHPMSPIPAVDVMAPRPDRAALDRLVANLGVDDEVLTWVSDEVA